MIHLLHQTVLESATRFPDKVAFRCGRDQLTYAELATKIKQLATVLLNLGVKKGDLVGLFLNRSIETAIAIHGVMLAGAAYVPLNPRAPAAVNRFQIKEGNFKVAITNPSQQSALQSVLSEEAIDLPNIIGLSSVPIVTGVVPNVIPWPTIFSVDITGFVPPNILGSDLAYIMYTSGSTGNPKGMMHTHDSGLSFARLMAHHFQLTENDVLGNHAPIYFDISTPGYFTAPLLGATTVIASDAHTIFPASMGTLLETERISVWYSVPLALVQLLEKGGLETKELPYLRHVLYAGEPFAPKYLRRLMLAFPALKVSNLYGPAETNVCTYYDLPGPPENDEPISIGEVWNNTERIILDENGKETDGPGMGELCIRSVTTMAGYLNRPDLTEQAFYVRINQHGREEKFYRTGDLVELDAAGLLHFRGRKDHQLKIRGYRVEPDAIETRMLAHPLVAEAVIVPSQTDEGTLRMDAAVILKTGTDLTGKELQTFVGEQFPWYAIPENISFFDDFPRTGSGKIDRGSLAETLLL